MAEEIIGVKVKVDASDVGKSVGSLKQQLREAQSEVNALSEKFGATSKEAINAAKKAAQLKDAIGDARALTDAFNPDQKFRALSSSLSGAAGGFAALQGAVGLFGNKAEAVEKTLLKVQSALALSQGLEAVGNSIDSFKVLGSVIKDSVSKAFGTLRSAIISTGIGALVIGVGLLIANFETVKKVVLNFIPGLGKLADFIGKLVNKVTDFVGVTSEAGRATAKLIEDNDKAIKNSERFLELNADKYDEYTQRKIKAKLEFKKKQNEFQKDEQLTEEQKNAFILQAMQKANREIAKADEDRNNAAIEANKKLAEKQKEIDDKSEGEKERIEKENEQITQDRYARQDAAFEVNRKAFIATQTDSNKELLAIEDEYEKNRSTLIRAGITDFAAIEEEKRLAILAVTEKYDKVDSDNKKKIKDEQKQKDEDALKILQANKDRELEFINKIAKTIDEKRVAEIAAVEEDYNRKIALAQKNGEDIVNLEKLKALAINDINKTSAEKDKKLAQDKFDVQVQLALQSLAIIGGLVDQNSAAGKAIAVTQAIINTYQGASKAIAQGGIFGPVAAAATIAAGLINVKKIISTKIPSASGSGNVGGGSTPSIDTAAPIAPSAQIQNTVTSLSQQSINQMGSATGRAYVVESDITNSQEKIIRINRAARLG